MREHKKNKINKEWMAWSNGDEIHLSPNVRRQVDNYGAKIIDYQYRLDERYTTANHMWFFTNAGSENMKPITIGN